VNVPGARVHGRQAQGRRAVMPIALLFAVAGVLHFASPGFFVRIVPPWVPRAELAVSLSGVAEMAGAIGLLIPATRVAAGWGLIALLVAVFPANVYMLQQAMAHGASSAGLALLWVRLPLQPLLIWWVWRSGIRHG
jgi:uncharacterized membrane protein